MRNLMLVAAVAGLTACATASAPPQRTADDQARLDRLLAGKTPGEPRRCLPMYRTRDMVVIDDYTIVFRDGRTIYINQPLGGCSRLGHGNYALVTRTFNSELCRGDIAQVVDPTSGVFAGSCAMGDFIPYRS